MRAHSSAYLAALAMLVGGLGCASTTARTDDSPSAAARDTSTTTTAVDTGSVQTPTGPTAQPVDTFLERQGTGVPQDTLGGYGGVQTDSSGMTGMDSTSMDTSTAR